MKVADLAELMELIEDKRRERDRLEGELKVIKGQLKKEGFSSLGELDEAISELNEEIEALQQRIDKHLEKLKKVLRGAGYEYV